MSGISIQQIEIFLTLANARSISAAARTLYISQPAVSASLRAMETELGIKLMSRDNRGSMLTAAGQRIYAELDPVYKRFKLAADRILTMSSDLGSNALTLGSFHDPEVIRFMLTASDRYEVQHPDRRVTAEYYNHHELRDKLLCEELDMVFTFSFEIMGRPDMECRRLHALNQYFIIPSSYYQPLSKEGYGYLYDKPLILEASSGRETMLSICRAHGFEPKRIKYVNSLILLAQMIADGHGFSIGGRFLPNGSMLAPKVHFAPMSVLDCNEYVHIVAAWRRDDENPALHDLLDVVESADFLNDAVANQRKPPGSKWY